MVLISSKSIARDLGKIIILRVYMLQKIEKIKEVPTIITEDSYTGPLR